jgi:predicted CopG family antitoxin
MKPNYNDDYNDEIQKVKNGHTMFSDVISQIDNIQENINKSVMSKYKN